MLLNSIIILLVIVAVIFGLFFYYRSLKSQDWSDEYVNKNNLDYLTRAVAEIFAAILEANLKEMNMTRAQVEKNEHLKSELRSSLKEAAYGNKNSKKFVINYIKDLLLTHPRIKITPGTGAEDNIIHFSTPESLKPREKFDILMHIYTKKYQEKGFVEMVYEYGLRKPIFREDGSFYYEINTDRIDEIFDLVMIDEELTFMDKIEIIAQRVFADYKGLGVVDNLYDTTVDEIDAGVSGIPKDSYEIKQGDIKNMEFSYESIWVMIGGVNIKMSCLSFGTQDELVRVCQNIYKFNPPASLSRKNGYVVSTMKDGSRIVVCRPPFCESWCFFLRKFDSTPSIDPDKLFIDEDNIIPITLMKWLIKGERTIAITGGQGSGKSTTLKSFVRFIREYYNLRVQELAFELNLRFTYPKRSIVTFQETDEISAQAGLDLQKKTNGTVNIIGEVASAEAASWVIQTSMVASLFTIFTHHAKTTHDLIIAIRNNLLETGGYNNEKAAEEMVAKVLNIDCHMEKDGKKGHRYCERITEIIPIFDRRYPSEVAFAENGTPILENADVDKQEFYKRMTDRKVFEDVNLMEWENGRYVMKNMPSPRLIAEIRKVLSDDEEKLFLQDMKMLENMMSHKVSA